MPPRFAQRDALGQVAVQSTAAGDLSNDAAWTLQDRLGSSIATTTTDGRVTDLADYSDFGVPVFDSTGWAGSTGFTGELGDATTGLNSYFSRTYDPFAATWLSPDSYRGTLIDPGTQNRYGYVTGNPASMYDSLGFDGRKGGKPKVTAPRGYGGPPAKPTPPKGPTGPSGPSIDNGGGGGGGGGGGTSPRNRIQHPSDRSKVPVTHPPITDQPFKRFGSECNPASPRLCANLAGPLRPDSFRDMLGMGGCLATVAPQPNASCSRVPLDINDPSSLLLDFGVGFGPKRTVYGEGSSWVELMKDEQRFRVIKNGVVGGLASGNIETGDAGYQAGSPGFSNPNFVRDVLTMMTWDFTGTPTAAQMKVALGTYDLYVIPTNVNMQTGTATLVYHGYNETSMASLLRTGDADFYNFLKENWPSIGPGSTVSQEFYWTEEVRFK